VGKKCVGENLSVAPLGLVSFSFFPTAYAVGCILTPLRSYELMALLYRNATPSVSPKHKSCCSEAPVLKVCQSSLRGQDPAQFSAQNFAGWRSGQGIHEMDLTGLFMRSEALGNESA